MIRRGEAMRRHRQWKAFFFIQSPGPNFHAGPHWWRPHCPGMECASPDCSDGWTDHFISTVTGAALRERETMLQRPSLLRQPFWANYPTAEDGFRLRMSTDSPFVHDLIDTKRGMLRVPIWLRTAEMRSLGILCSTCPVTASSFLFLPRLEHCFWVDVKEKYPYWCGCHHLWGGRIALSWSSWALW